MYKFQELNVCRIKRNHQLAVGFKVKVGHVIFGDFGSVNDPHQSANQFFDVIHVPVKNRRRAPEVDRTAQRVTAITQRVSSVSLE
jgi:hypothetical protein